MERVKQSQDMILYIQKVIRKQKYLSTEVEKSAGIAIGSMSRWIRDRNNPQLKNLIKLMDIVKIKMIIKDSITDEIITINTAQDIIEIFYNKIKNKEIDNIRYAENAINVSQGLISRCRNRDFFSTKTAFELLDFMNFEVFLQYD